MTGVLPYQLKFVLLCQTDDLRLPRVILAQFVAIQENCPMGELSSFSFLLGNAKDRQLDQFQRIAAARLQHIVVEMKMQASLIRNLIQSFAVTLLTLALAAEVDAGSLHPQPAHPMRGTAPYTPPRYFW